MQICRSLYTLYLFKDNTRIPVPQTLREKCQNTELFLVRIFRHSDRIRRDTDYLSVFSPNAGKYRPEITPHLDTFHAVRASELLVIFVQSNPVSPDKFVSSILRLDKQ